MQLQGLGIQQGDQESFQFRQSWLDLGTKVKRTAMKQTKKEKKKRKLRRCLQR